MKKILLLLILYCSLLSMNGFAQSQHKIDSLKNELKKFDAHKKELGTKATPLMDSMKAIIFYELVSLYYSINSDSTLYYAEQCKSLSERIGYKKGIGNAYNGLGAGNELKGNNMLALEYFQKSLKIRKEIGAKNSIAWSYTNLGIVYDKQGNYPEALKYKLAGLKVREEIGDKKGIIMAYNDIGWLYSDMGNYPEALKYQMKTLKVKKEIGDKGEIAVTYGSIAEMYEKMGNYSEALKNVQKSVELSEELGDKWSISLSYRRIGYIYNSLGDYPSALKNELTAIKAGKELGDKDLIGNGYLSLGRTYSHQMNYSEAVKYFLIANKYFEELGIEGKGFISDSYIDLGLAYEKQGNLQEALKYESKGLSMVLKSGRKDKIAECYKNLAGINSSLHNYKTAYDNEKLFKQYYDSLYNKENEKKLTSLQMQYEFDKKESLAKVEQEQKNVLILKELQKQKLVRNGFVGGFAVVLIFAGVFFSQRNKIKKGKKLSDELLLNVLPSEVAEELKQKGKAEAKHFNDVTVMFTDFKDFTEISEKLSPSELVAEIDTCFKAFDNILDKYNIEKIKTIGDSYMCAGGLPVPNKTHASDVVKAALEIQKFMGEHSQQKIKEGKKVFELRIGIHSGSVVAGIVGIKKFAYDIWGNTVNIASRMESSGEAGKVNISGSTYEHVRNEFNCIHRGKIEAKHMGMIDMYFVTDPQQ